MALNMMIYIRKIGGDIKFSEWVCLETFMTRGEKLLYQTDLICIQGGNTKIQSGNPVYYIGKCKRNFNATVWLH